jgi:hypothetical protein
MSLTDKCLAFVIGISVSALIWSIVAIHIAQTNLKIVRAEIEENNLMMIRLFSDIMTIEKATGEQK